jgi:hypothetical protein
LDVKVTDTAVTVNVSAAEPLLALANALDWCHIAHLAIPDLKRTTKGGWYLGRRLSLRSHLAVMILQTLLKETDRGMEKRIQLTPMLQVFCGATVLLHWRCPDHTKIEELRNRLAPDTHRAIGVTGKHAASFSRASDGVKVASVQITGAADGEDNTAAIGCEGMAWDDRAF